VDKKAKKLDWGGLHYASLLTRLYEVTRWIAELATLAIVVFSHQPKEHQISQQREKMRKNMGGYCCRCQVFISS
jgi:hypothetical protein